MKTYEIDSKNFTVDQTNNITNNNYYYPINPINNYLYKSDNKYNINKNYYNTNISSYYNSLKHNLDSKYKTDYYNKYGQTNKFYDDNLRSFTTNNINFNNNSNKKIILTYEYKNISPIEISKKTKEIIKLQFKMCNLNPKKCLNLRRIKSASKPKTKNKKIMNKNNLTFQNQNNLKFKRRSFYNTTNGGKNGFNFKKNKIFNSNKRLSRTNFSRMIRGFNSLEKNRNNIWKDKYLKVNEEIKKIKNKIEKIQKNNDSLEKRLNFVKENEENKYALYEDYQKYKDYNIQLLEKYEISEMIRQKQIDLIIKMQKEINNMKENLKKCDQFN